MIIPRKADLSKSKHEKIRASTPPYELIIIIVVIIIKKIKSLRSEMIARVPRSFKIMFPLDNSMIEISGNTTLLKDLH